MQRFPSLLFGGGASTQDAMLAQDCPKAPNSGQKGGRATLKYLCSFFHCITIRRVHAGNAIL